MTTVFSGDLTHFEDCPLIKFLDLDSDQSLFGSNLVFTLSMKNHLFDNREIIGGFEEEHQRS